MIGGFMRRLFGRSKPIPDRRDHSEDWKAGDLSVCISEDWFDGIGPKIGDLNRVDRVIDAKGCLGIRAYFLFFSGSHVGWESRAFRKVRPDENAADSAFTALIKRKKTVRA